MNDVTDTGMSHVQEALHHSAVMAAQTENWTRSATKYRKLLMTMPIGSTPIRYFIFASYTSVFRHNKITIPDEVDTKFIRDRDRDPNESKAIRCLLALTRGIIAYAKGDRTKTVQYYRAGLDMDASMSARERHATIYVPNHATGKFKRTSIAEFYDDFVGIIRNNLAALEGRPYAPMVDPTHVQNTRIDFEKVKTPEDLARLDLAWRWQQEIGCHACHDSTSKSQKCARCQIVRYCSTECQHRDWKEGGHRLRCRKASVWIVGDIVKVHGLVGKPELNGMLLEIREAHDDTEPASRVSVGEVGDTENVMLIKRANLRLILPTLRSKKG